LLIFPWNLQHEAHGKLVITLRKDLLPRRYVHPDMNCAWWWWLLF
jgi:hypothetical protein